MLRELAHRRIGDLLLGDVVLAGGIAVFGVLDVLLSPDWRGPAEVNVVAAAVMGGALAWRRRRPIATLAVQFGVMAVLAVAFGSSQTWTSVFAVVISVYSAAVHGRSLLPAVGVIVVGVAIRDLHDPRIETVIDSLWTSSVVALIFIAGLVGRNLRTQKEAVEARADAVEREEEGLAAAAAAEERQRIARELHDIVSHSLGVLVLQAGAAESVLDQDPMRARETLRSIRATGQEAITEMGTLLGLVRGEPETSREPQPSLDDLPRLVDRAGTGDLEVTLEVEGSRRRLPAALELSAFRVVQEGITNALKHGAAGRITVHVRYGDHELQIRVADDGPGNGAAAGGRRGLIGLRERVDIFGGRLEAGPRPEGGWLLHATFPVPR